MGDCSNSKLLPMCDSGEAPFDTRRYYKHIHDNVHGNIYLDKVRFLIRFFLLCFACFDSYQNRSSFFLLLRNFEFISTAFEYEMKR